MAYRGEMKEVALSSAKPNDLLSVEEVAELCGMSHSRVCQLLRAGLMKGEKLRGVFWQIARKEAEKFSQRPTAAGRPRISEAG